MSSEHPIVPSKSALIAGRIISGLCIVFFLLDGVMKILKLEPAVKASLELGLPENIIRGLGHTLVICTVLYASPATCMLGAILLTGYLGGAIATHVRMGGPVFNIVFAATFGILVWLGLYLREPRLRAILLIR